MKSQNCNKLPSENVYGIDYIPPCYEVKLVPVPVFSPQMIDRAEDKQERAPIDTSIYNMKITCEERGRGKTNW